MTELQRIIEASEIKRSDLADRLAMAPSTLSQKLAGLRGWDPAEVVALDEALGAARWKYGHIRRPGLRTLCLLCGSRTAALIK